MFLSFSKLCFSNYRFSRLLLCRLPERCSIFHFRAIAITLYSTVRGKYREIRKEDIAYFQNLLGPAGVITDKYELEKYNTDWLKSRRGNSKVVLCPKQTEEVSSILSYCNQHRLAVCPQGGNTGLVGGGTPVFDEVILSMRRMNEILHFDEITGVLTSQAGCVLESLDSYVSEQNFIVPLDLGAKGSCLIGGNVATNAGGLRLIRYGSLHANILGLEVVLANGDVLNCMSSVRKDNTGYDVKRLFLGSEGTLGVITQVALLCHPKPSSTAVAFLGCNSFEQVLNSVKLIKQKLPEVLSSLEMLDHQAAEAVKDNLKLTVPIAEHQFYILIEVSGSNSTHDGEKLTECLNALMENGLVTDGTLTTESSKIKALWAIRERITEALLLEGCGYKYDISLPLTEFYKVVEVLRAKLKNRVTRCCGYGHLGDGNIHFNVTTRQFDQDVLDTIEPFIYNWTAERKGSISAEHGIGFKKKQYLCLNKTQEAIRIMKSLKELLDPNGILNPYKLFE